MVSTDPPWIPAYVGLGSNLDDPPRQVQLACQALDRIPDTHLRCRSRLYRTSPLGPADQPDFLNGVALLDTRLPPLDLLDAFQAIEIAQKRRRGAIRWGPRTLDLDLLLYGTQIIDHGRLRVPHPELAQRSFVVLPLAEIAPVDLEIPGLGPLAKLRDAHRKSVLTPWD